MRQHEHTRAAVQADGDGFSPDGGLCIKHVQSWARRTENESRSCCRQLNTTTSGKPEVGSREQPRARDMRRPCAEAHKSRKSFKDRNAGLAIPLPKHSGAFFSSLRLLAHRQWYVHNLICAVTPVPPLRRHRGTLIAFAPRLPVTSRFAVMTPLVVPLRKDEHPVVATLRKGEHSHGSSQKLTKGTRRTVTIRVAPPIKRRA